jgi:hypothetical protein
VITKGFGVTNYFYLQEEGNDVECEVLTPVVINVAVFWDIEPCT